MSTKFNTEAVLSGVVSACEAAAIHWENMARDEMDMFEDEDVIMELDEARFEELDDDLLKPRQVRDVGPRPSYKDSEWMAKLREVERLRDPDSPAARLFRRRFRIPYQFFERLLTLVRREGWFSEQEVDVAMRSCIPIELKVS